MAPYLPVTPPRPTKARLSSSSSVKSRRSDRVFDDTPHSNDREQSRSPITPPEDPAYGRLKRPSIRGKLVGPASQINDSESDDGSNESPPKSPMDNRRRRQRSPSGWQPIVTRVPATTRSRRSSTTSRQERHKMTNSERSEDETELREKQDIPDPYRSFSAQPSSLASRFPPNPRSSTGLDGDIVLIKFLPPKPQRSSKRRSVSQIETEYDIEEQPRTPSGKIRPTFQPFQFKGRPRPSKDRRSINFEILKCLMTASKKKKKATPTSTLGCIYVFESPEHAPYYLKVGKSSRDPMKRKSEWENSCGIKLVEVEDTDRNFFDYYDIVESLLQTELQNLRRMYKCTSCKRQHGEWFEVDKRTVLEVVNRWRTWIKEEQPFDEAWNLTAYWQWRVERAKVSISDVKWVEWTQSSRGDRFHYDFLKPYRERKDARSRRVGCLLVLLMLVNYGVNCSILTFIGLLFL